MRASVHPTAGGGAIYLDHAATAPLRPEVWRAMEAAVEACFNPASAHAFGRAASRCLEEARGRLAELLGCQPAHVVFTSGGTQANNLAVLGFVRAQLRAQREEGAAAAPREPAATAASQPSSGRPRVLVSAVEHKATLEAARQAAAEGAEVRFLPVDETGTLELDVLERELAGGDGPTLVSLMWANNEVGTVQPVAQAAELARQHGARFHTDAVQAVGKVGIRFEGLPLDMLTATAHKLGGPVGIGALVRRRSVPLAPLTFGASQEASLWPGTQNPLGATGFARACELAVEEREEAVDRWRALRAELATRLRQALPEIRIHAEDAPERLPHLLSVGLPGRDTGALLLALDLDGVAVSAGAACSSGSTSGSAVLAAMGIDPPEPYATLRFSFGHATTPAEVERAAEATIRAASQAPAGPAR